MPKFIEFDEVMPHPKGIWLIRNKKSRSVLGRIEWYAKWRQYVAIFEEDCVWSIDCLADVQAVMAKIGGTPGVVRPQ